MRFNRIIKQCISFYIRHMVWVWFTSGSVNRKQLQGTSAWSDRAFLFSNQMSSDKEERDNRREEKEDIFALEI